jgi:Holliday junction resolvasome RuvABC endonuclease subunit
MDPGLAHVGVAVVGRYGAKLDLIDSCHIETPPDMELNDRLRLIWRRLAVCCRDYRPSVLAIEDQAGVSVGARMSAKRQVEAAAKGRTIKAFGFSANNDPIFEVCGVAKAVAFGYGIPVVMYTAGQAKIAVCGKGKGRAEKREVIAAVRYYFKGIERDGHLLGEHEADAIAGAIYVERVTMLQARRAG